MAEEPEQVVREFIRAMHEWEVEAYERYKASIFDETDHARISAAHDAVSRERKQVVARYCSNTDRYPAPFGFPPQYDPAHEKIVEVRRKTAQRVEVLTEYVVPKRYLHEKRRYKILLTPEGWKINDRTTERNRRWYSSL